MLKGCVDLYLYLNNREFGAVTSYGTINHYMISCSATNCRAICCYSTSCSTIDCCVTYVEYAVYKL
jgi:hypothetical protein